MPGTSSVIPPPQKDYHLDTQWEVPDEREWVTTYRKYKSFKLPGSDEQYKTNQFVYIFPDPEEGPAGKAKKVRREVEDEDEANNPDSDPWWIGLIKEIRAKDEKNVFIVVNWMYTTMTQLRTGGILKLPKRINGHEIFYSHFTDILPVHVVEDHAKVVEFDESNPLQDPIGSHDVWYRSEIRVPSQPEITASTPGPSGKATKKRKARSSVSNQRPSIVPRHAPTCTCHKPYEPLPFGTGPMVYCPRTSCKKWYHIACLEDSDRTGKATATLLRDLSSSGLDLIPPSNRPEIAPTNSIISVSDPSPKGPNRPLPTPDPEPLTPIRAAAQESILRGDEKTGIVGNGQKVLFARDIAFKAQTRPPAYTGVAPPAGMESSDLSGLIKEWTDKFDADDDVKGRVKVEKRTSVWICPGCQGPI